MSDRLLTVVIIAIMLVGFAAGWAWACAQGDFGRV